MVVLTADPQGTPAPAPSCHHDHKGAAQGLRLIPDPACGRLRGPRVVRLVSVSGGRGGLNLLSRA